MIIETRIILVGLLSVIAVLFVMPQLIRTLLKYNVYDIPNERSAHVTPTPSMGGITFFSGLILCSVLVWNRELALTSLLIGSAGLLGLWDDFKDISPRVKLLGQITIAAGLYFVGFSVAPMFQMFFDVTLAPWLSFMLTIVFVAGIMNSFNLLDGVDGLLAGVGMVCSIAFALVFFFHNDFAFMALSVAITGVLLAFLIYNYNPASIFMGDTGSLLIGAYIAVCILRVTAMESVQSSTVALACMVLSGIDMTRLFLGRYLLTKQPFLADKNHMHHVLLRLQWNPKKIMGYVVTLQIGLLTVGFMLGSRLGLFSNALIVLLVGITYLGILQLLLFQFEKRQYLEVVEQKNNETINNELLKTYLDENEVHFYN